MKIDIACSQCIALDVANHCNHTDNDLYNVADGSLFRSRPKASKLNRFKCSQCSKAYTRKANLVDHVQSEHSTEPVKYPCKKCSKTFLRMSDRNRHERNQHGDMRFVCGQQPDHEGDGCGIAFARLDALKEHRSTLKCAKSRRKAADQEYLIRRLDRLGNMLYEISAEAARSRSSSPDARVLGNEPSELRRVDAVLQLGDDTRYHESGSSDPSFWAGWQDRQASGKNSPRAATKVTQEMPTEPTLSSQAREEKAERLRRLRSDFKSQYPEIVNPGPVHRDHTSRNGNSSIHAVLVNGRSVSKSDLTVARNEDDDQVDRVANRWQTHRRQEDLSNVPTMGFDRSVQRDALSEGLANANHLHLSQSIKTIVKADDKTPKAQQARASQMEMPQPPVILQRDGTPKTISLRDAFLEYMKSEEDAVSRLFSQVAVDSVQLNPGMHVEATQEQAKQGAQSLAPVPLRSEQLAYFGQGHRTSYSPIPSSLPGAPPMEGTGLRPAKTQGALRPSMPNSSDLLDVIGWDSALSPHMITLGLDMPNNAFEMLLAASETMSNQLYVLEGTRTVSDAYDAANSGRSMFKI